MEVSRQTTSIQKSQNSYEKQQRWNFINLIEVYKCYYLLPRYDEKPDEIHASIRIHISPLINISLCQSLTLQLSQKYNEFEELNCINFHTTIKLPEIFKKFKFFYVAVEFMGKTFFFILSMKKPYHILNYKERLTRMEFLKSTIKLNFES